MINHVQQFPQLFGGVKSIQTGQINAELSSPYESYSVTINAVDPDRSIAFFFGGSNGYNTQAYYACITATQSTHKYCSNVWNATVSGATTLSLATPKALVASGSYYLKGVWFVIEFHNTLPNDALTKSGGIKSIQTGTGYNVAPDGTGSGYFGSFDHYKDITISSVTPGNCIAFVDGGVSTSAYFASCRGYSYYFGDYNAYLAVPVVTSATNLRIISPASTSGTYKFAYRWTVIEFNL